MTAKEIRIIAKRKLEGKFGKAFLILFLYTLLISLANSVPLIGSMAMLVISPVLTFGIYKSIVLLINGEKVGVFDYFKFGFNNFVKVWQLIWEVLKKTWVPLALMLLGCGLVFGSIFIGSLGTFIVASAGTSDAVGIIWVIITFLGIGVSFLVMIGGIIWYIIKCLPYTLVNFYLIKNPNLTAKEIMELNEKDIKNNVGKVARIMFLYMTLSVLISFSVGFLFGFFGTLSINLLLSLLGLSETIINLVTQIIISVVSGIIGAATNGFIMPKMISSYNELHEYITHENNLVSNTENI